MQRIIFLICILLFSVGPFNGKAQNRPKEINKQDQVWVSINNTVRLSDKWGFVADLHERRNNFLKDQNFLFIRLGANYWLKDNITAGAGYGHLWLSPTTPGLKTIAKENRLYQQIQMNSKAGAINVVQRLRNEERWQQKIADDKFIGDYKFTNRVRYLLSAAIPFSKKNGYPSLVVSDELFIQFGKEVVYNTFDQNRLFIGIKQKLSKDLSFDLGYMQVKQQKASGYQYDVNNTLRCFFYYMPDCRKQQVISR